jgi:hypothetical protein
VSDEPLTRLTLFVPCRARPKDPAVEFEWLDNPRDGSFAQSFSFGTIDAEGMKRIDAAPGALVLQCPFDLGEGRSEAVKLIERISEALAVRVEQSKLGWERNRWVTTSALCRAACTRSRCRTREST